MFSGIVQGVGVVQDMRVYQGRSEICIRVPMEKNRFTPGSSIAVDGACLTVVRHRGRSVWCEIIPETARKTILGEKRSGDLVNIELPLRIGDPLDGHVVSGHIDGTGKVVNMSTIDADTLLTVTFSRALMSYIVPQGSIAINGVALTVARVERQQVTVALTEYTRTHTTLRSATPGMSVNIETDLMAKYVVEYQKRIRRHS